MRITTLTLTFFLCGCAASSPSDPPPHTPFVPRSDKDLAKIKDSRVRYAALMHDIAATHEEAIFAALTEVYNKAKAVTPKDLDSIDEAKIIALSKHGNALLESFSHFEIALTQFKEAVGDLPTAYDAAALYYRELAAKNQEEPIHSKFLAREASVRSQPAIAAKGVTAYEEQWAKYSSAVSTVRASLKLLEEEGTHKSLLFKNGSGTDFELFRQQLKSYIKSFTRIQDLYEDIRDSLRTTALSPRLRQAYQDEQLRIAQEKVEVEEVRQLAAKQSHETQRRIQQEEEAEARRRLVEQAEVREVHRLRDLAAQQERQLQAAELARKQAQEAEVCRRQAEKQALIDRAFAECRGSYNGWHGFFDREERRTGCGTLPKRSVNVKVGHTYVVYNRWHNKYIGVMRITAEADRYYNYELVDGYLDSESYISFPERVPT